MMLTMAELAYPHWVNVAGAEPPDPEKRMYVVCATDAQQMLEAMKSDTGLGMSGGYGGGITIWSNKSAYNYPSGTLLYHQRALMIHENLHMLQMIVFNSPGSEGFTFSGEQHVYDAAKKQLTVKCFDKAPINNWTDSGLTELRNNFVPFTSAVDKFWNDRGGPAVIYTQFLWRDPDRWLKWCVWRDEYYAGRLNGEPNSRLMADIFGPLENLNADWEKWIREQRNSFQYIDWGWEQDGNALVAYGYPKDPNYWSQTNLNYAPGEKMEYNPLRMDYPAEPHSPLVGAINQGTAQPSVGYVVDMSRGTGFGGMGLGLQDSRSMCQVVIAKGGVLVIDGADLGIARKEVPLISRLQEAANGTGQRYGVTMQIKPKQLAVTVRAGAPGGIVRQYTTVPITSDQYERLINKPMSIIARGGSPAITPFIDDQRPLRDYSKPAAPNFWRFDGMEQLATLYKAAWRLKDKAPQSLLQLKEDMLAAVDQAPNVQAAAVKAYERRILDVARDMRNCDADAQLKALALADLTGTAIFAGTATRFKDGNRVDASVTLQARLKDPVEATVRIAVSPKPIVAPPKPQRSPLVTYRPKQIDFSLPLPNAATLATTIELSWRGQTIEVPLTQSIAAPERKSRYR